MALSSFLDLTSRLPEAPLENAELLGKQLAEKMDFEHYQKDFESPYDSLTCESPALTGQQHRSPSAARSVCTAVCYGRHSLLGA